MPQFPGSIIIDGTIYASKIAAGTIIAGIVDGTLIEGAQLIAFGTTGQILVYSGTPVTGNLIASISGATGTDDESNDYDTGIVVYNSPTAMQAGVTVQLMDGQIIFGDPLSADPQTFSADMGQFHVNTTGQVPITFINSAADDANGTHSAFWITGQSVLGTPAPTIHAFADGTAGIQAGADFLFNIMGTLVFGAPGGGLPVAAGPSMVLGGTTTVVIASAVGATAGTTDLLEVQGTVAMQGSVAIVGGAAETWHSLGTLASYTVNQGRYRMTPDNELEIEVSVTSSGANAASTTFSVTLPAGYLPAHTYAVPMAMITGTWATASPPNVQVSAAGAVSVHQAASVSAVITGVWRIPLT